MTDQLLNAAELAEYLRITPRTLRYWRDRKGGPPALALGANTLRWRRQDVEAWLTLLSEGKREQTARTDEGHH